MLSLVELPEPDYMWIGDDILLGYSNHSDVYGMCSEELYSDFKFVTGGQFIYERKTGDIFRICGELELFEGKCYIYLKHGFDGSGMDSIMTVGDMFELSVGDSSMKFGIRG